MPDSDLIAGENQVTCNPNAWTMVLPGDWEREYFGIGFASNPPTMAVSMFPQGDVNSRAAIAPNNTFEPVMEMWLERARTLVTQEWWMFNSGFAAFTVIVWTVRRLTGKPVRARSGLLLPARNGKTVDDLSGIDPAAMDTLLNQMRQQTRRFRRA